MGLDFSGSEVHFSYGGFARFRCVIARKAGLNLDHMIGFGGATKWDSFKDPIKYLLNHSDCDGKITAKQCALCGPRLLEIAEMDDPDPEWKEWIQPSAKQLGDDMIHCGQFGEPLEFC